MKNIETLIDDGGEITLGPVSGIVCVASAADGHNALAMLARCDGETLNALIKRLDKAIAQHYEQRGHRLDINSEQGHGAGFLRRILPTQKKISWRCRSSAGSRITSSGACTVRVPPTPVPCARHARRALNFH